MKFLKRKMEKLLADWKSNPERLPLVVRGARQVGKTFTIMQFAQANYKHVVAINFALQPQYRRIFDDGFEVDAIVKNITLIDPTWQLVPNETLIFFDEMQDCPNCATSLKPFKLDGRYDVICSGSMMGINYHEIESNSVGYKQDCEMMSLDFEEFLWALGYSDAQIDDLYGHLLALKPFSALQMQTMMSAFRDYVTIGGMPAIVQSFVTRKNFTNTLAMQRQLLLDYEEDITKYAQGLDKAKVKSIYHHISVFLGKENKKFQISKIAHGARNREYVGTVDWLKDAGIVNVCYCMDVPELPLKGNYNPLAFKIYFKDTGLLIASLDDEAQEDLRVNRNLGTYKGAIYENIVGDMLVKQGYELYYYRNEKSTLEMDFFVRDRDSLVPVEVKATDGATRSLRNLVDHGGKYNDIHYGIKLCDKNLGFDGHFYTIPYFMTFALRRFLRER